MSVCAPNVWPPRLTPAVALTLGASSYSRLAPDAPGVASETSCADPVSLLIATTRILPSRPRVAPTFTGPLGTVTGSSRERGGLGEHHQAIVLGGARTRATCRRSG